jgi:hypothetical protein
MADGSISTSVTGCLQLFQQLLSLEDSATDQSQRSIFTSLTEEKTRFKIWSGNIGAHKTGRSSLEFRLRDASHIKKQVLRLLEDLSTLVKDAAAIVAGEKTPWNEIKEDDDLYENDEDEDFPETELGQIATDVAEVVNCLLRLSVAIRNPAPHDRFIASAPTDTSHYEPFDIQHVRSKFGTISEPLAERLGKAISRRRQYFKYRESHHLKLSRGLEPGEEVDNQSTVASSIPEQMKNSGLNPTPPVIDEDALSDSGVSQTSFASSVANTEKLRVPPLTKDAQKGPFECPFCFMVIVATNTVSWRLVFSV